MEIKNYSLSFGNRKLADQVDVVFSHEKFNVVIGANGAGKTSFLDFVAGVGHKNASGTKVDIPSMTDVAYQLQHIHFFPTLTVAQTVGMYAQLGSESSQMASRTFTTIKREVLSKIWHTKMGQLSGGEQQIVLTYGQCLLDKQLYIFDEPTSGVDAANAETILQMINELVERQHKVVVITSHHLEQLKNFDVNLIQL
ncbi:AAA family ATPase [Leuconostoc lactis]|uniref:ATP-binding cassette domain-containing protein n=1 Tax=Leuconostoc lactis TaxID=1246 RepID=UPI00272A01E9|nr:ATP-binding cassette domain-containing protein [Leuconostoc lactis]WKY78476.1 AAA family ATPase [Leuconostoc lactis]